MIIHLKKYVTKKEVFIEEVNLFFSIRKSFSRYKKDKVYQFDRKIIQSFLKREFLLNLRDNLYMNIKKLFFQEIKIILRKYSIVI